MNELKNAESTSYKAACLAFINSIIIASEQFDERVRIRNEFVGEFILINFTHDFSSCYGYAEMTKIGLYSAGCNVVRLPRENSNYDFVNVFIF